MHRFNFIKELLGGIGSSISSRRTVMVWFVLLFSFEIVLNIFTKLEPSAELRMELFQVLIVSLVLVFGDIVIKVIDFLKGNKSETTKIDPPADATK